MIRAVSIAALALAISSGTAARAASCAPTAFKPDGVNVKTASLRGPGLLLSGAGAGNMPNAALTWMRAHLGPPAGRAGNVVILRASDARENTDDFYAVGKFGWVQEILIPPCATPAQVDSVASYVDRADAVFFAGGDQSHYVAWRHSALARAVRAVYARGGIVGGGSAGLAIQGAVVYDAAAADRLHPNDDDWEVDSKNAIANPLEPEISFTTDLFAWPPLRNTITDTHFAARDRFGRLVAFLARIVHSGLGTAPYYGLGVDQGSVVLVERDGTAMLRKKPQSHGAYLVRLAGAVPLAAGTPLVATVSVAPVTRDGEHFDLANKRVDAPWTNVTVDGRKTPAYSAPYSGK